MVPLPNFVLNSLSAKLQLISSWIGVEFIRACDILVYLEGNVIDLGGYKLQVVDACSGLRYLFPLSSLAFLCAYLFKGPFWQKLLIFLSSAPLTIFMNSFRIGVIGVLVNYWGKSMAEGFLHDFEGWAVFLLCMSLLFVEMWILSRLSGKPLAFNQLVQIPDDWSTFVRTETAAKALNSSIYTVFLVLIIGGGLSEKLNTRVDIIPQRKDFLSFPSQIASWHGQNEYLGQAYLDELKLTDYVMMNYVKTETNDKINFYSAYYQSQRKGAGVHSPRTCISGSGWRITLFEELNLPNFKIDGEPLKVDRAIIESGESKQLVYFWFQQRGRILTDEIKMKWYIFLDSMMENRTDGSLIRLITEINKSEDISVADQRIQTFMKDLLPLLDDYIPGKTATPAFYVPSDN
jgi:exosortase D (VPLPA-CTERM-specific)